MKNTINFHLLVNETAGNGHAKKIFDQIVILLVDRNLSFTVHKSNYAGELVKLAENYGNQDHKQTDILLVIGGDGSLNEVLNGIKRSANPDTPIAYLPAGTGNDFARAASLTSDPNTLLNHLLTNSAATEVDCGSFELVGYGKQTCYFANSFGIGFDASVNHISNNSHLKNILNQFNQGNLVYGLNILNALRKQDTFSVDVIGQNEQLHFDNVYLVTTTNHPYFGGGIPLLPNADITSHKLDAVVIERKSLPRLVRLLINLLKDGSHVYDEQFHYLEAEKISISTNKQEFGQVDGEELAKQKFALEFSIEQFNLLK